MANKIVQLVDNESNNIFPVAGSMAGDSVTTQMIQDGAVTSDKIDFTIYGSTEKIVGTWIDGKPLYRKTISFSIQHTAAGTTTAHKYAHGISNVDTIMVDRSTSYNAVDKSQDGTIYGVDSMFYNGSTITLFMRCYADPTNVCIDILRNANVTYPFVITLLYTKTTD